MQWWAMAAVGRRDIEDVARLGPHCLGCRLVGLVLAVLMLADRGYELTDEGFYLNWLSSPGLWPTSTTLFGFVYHPLFVVLDGDITQMRRVAVVLTLGLSWVAAFLALGPARHSWPRVIGVAISTAVASEALRIHNLWLLTPNYNILVLQSALLIATGLLLWWERERTATNVPDVPRRSVLMQWGGATLVGLGGVALFMAKPPGATATGMVVALAVVLGCRSRRMMLLSAVIAATTLIVVTMIVDGSPAGTVDRFEPARTRCALSTLVTPCSTFCLWTG